MTDSKKIACEHWKVGDRVEKAQGYRFPGWIVGIISKRNGQVRFVVEDDRESLHIFNESQLRVRTATIDGDA